MFNKYNERSASDNLAFTTNCDISGQFELLLLPEQLDIMERLPEESDLESNDYFMELELEFDEQDA